jgi:hypothetical protein
MTDLDLIRELRPAEPLPDARRLAPARGRLTDAITAELAQALAPASAHRFVDDQRGVASPPVTSGRTVRPRRRLALATVALTAAAAGVAAAVLLAIPGSRPAHGPTPPSAASGPASHPGNSSHSSHTGQASHIKPFTGRLTAARFLKAAARAALTQPATPPRPGQFVYAETEGPGGSSRYQIWQSADGSQPGLVINSTGAIPLSPCSIARAEAGHCAATAGYLPGLPVRPGAILAYLPRIGLAGAADQPGGSKLHKPIANWVANDIGKTLAVMLSDTYLQPAQRAALYEYMARTPGFTVDAHATDALGRSGVGIQWIYQGITNVIIFSRQDYAYLGDKTVSPGQPAYSSALVKFGIVDSLPPQAKFPPTPKPVLKGNPDHSPTPGPSPRG